MSYSPNFSDPRVVKRINRALGFAVGVLSDKSHPWSTRYIDKYFGQQQHQLSQYLRDILLITTNNHFSITDHKCKEYRLNQLGARYLRERLEQLHSLSWFQFVKDPSASDVNTNNITNTHTIPYCITSPTWEYDMIKNWVKSDFAQEISTGDFQYTESNNRLFHPIQNIRKQHREQLLAEEGLKYDYDIQCCAPTLILQYAKKLGIKHSLITLTAYVKNRHVFRQQLADNAEISLETSKKLINALFNGARLGNNIDYKTSEMLNYDMAKIAYLKQDAFVTSLRSDIKKCWDIIKKNEPKFERIDSDGVISTDRFNSRRKWSIYFRLERVVMNSIRTYVKSQRMRCLMIHDGWSCDTQLDEQDLIAHVLRETGYEVQFESRYL